VCARPRCPAPRHVMVAAARVECVGGGEPLVFPDFTLRHEGGSVLVEVVGFYTPKYLRSKLDALRAAAAHPLIACIDESLACADEELAFAVFRFKRRIDPAALIAIAERLREEHRSGALKAAWTERGDNPTTSH
jgi:predicted nuclease of restriction endonuclease-like RecB superfamily